MNCSIERRAFVRQAITAVGGGFLAGGHERALASSKARNLVLVLMAGGPSQADTFDFEPGPWTPAAFAPLTCGGLRFPHGLMPRIADQLEWVALLRGVRAPATSHGLAQAGLPAFRTLGMSGEESVYGERCCLLRAAHPAVALADRARYGSSRFGDACLTACALLRAPGGPHLVEITIGGWDNHSDIYGTALNARDARSVARRFDAGLGALLADLRADGLLAQTLIVAMGEFGRIPGPLNAQGGRDHFQRHSALLAGAGIAGGRAIHLGEAEGRQTTQADEPGDAAYFFWRLKRLCQVEESRARRRENQDGGEAA